MDSTTACFLGVNSRVIHLVKIPVHSWAFQSEIGLVKLWSAEFQPLRFSVCNAFPLKNPEQSQERDYNVNPEDIWNWNPQNNPSDGVGPVWDS